MRFLTRTLILLLFSIHNFVSAQNYQSAKSILLKSDQKIKNLNSIKYRISVWDLKKKSEKPLFTSVTTHLGNLKFSNQDNLKTKVDSEITLAGHTMEIDYYYNLKSPNSTAIIDHSEYNHIIKIEDNLITPSIHVYVPRVLYYFRIDKLEGKLTLSSIAGKNSFSNKNAKILKEELIGDELCYKIEQKSPSRVAPNGKVLVKEKTSYLWIGKKSMMPRAFQSTEFRGTIDILEQNSKYSSADLTLENPKNKPTIVKTKKDIFSSKKNPLVSIGKTLPEIALDYEIFPNKKLKNLDSKLVLLDFWGTWCAPCKKKMPSIQKIYDTYKDKGLMVISVSVYDPPYYDKHYLMNENYTFFNSSNGYNLAENLNVRYYPTVYIVNSKGKVLYSGSSSYEKLIQVIDKNL